MSAFCPSGFVIKSEAPDEIASKVILAPFLAIEDRIITGVFSPILFFSFKNSIPFISGISRSRIIISGLRTGIFCSANIPFIAFPATVISSCDSIILLIKALISAESSTISIFILSVSTSGFLKIDYQKEHSCFDYVQSKIFV